MSAAARPARAKLLLIIALFALPIVASYLAYFVWRPTGGVRNYGVLLPVQTVPESVRLYSVTDGEPIALKSLRGKWLLVQVDGAACDKTCEAKLYAMRQVRLMQGRDQTRLERVWILSDGGVPSATLQQTYAGGLFVVDKAGALLPLLTTADKAASGAALSTQHGPPKQGIYLIDPLGNLIMRWTISPETEHLNNDIKHMHKDIGRLLRASQIG